MLVVDWHEPVHVVMALLLSTLPGAKVFQTDGALAHPLSPPLPSGPGLTVSANYFGPLPVTPRRNAYILLVTDRFSRRADMYADSAAEFTTKGTAGILINNDIPL